MNLTIFLLLLGAVFIVVLNLFAIWWFGGMLIPLLAGGGPYVPSNDNRVKKMIELAKIKSNDVVMDLGSGDGRLLIAALEAGAGNAIGYEVHPGLVKFSRKKLARKGFADQSTIFKKSMWDADMSGITLVLLYQIPYSMEKLGEKLLSELPRGARVVSNAFEFPNWEFAESDSGVHVYVKQ